MVLGLRADMLQDKGITVDVISATPGTDFKTAFQGKPVAGVVYMVPLAHMPSSRPLDAASVIKRCVLISS